MFGAQQWLAIRLYHVIYKPRAASAELCVFTSHYDYAAIVLNCKSFFCGSISPWDSNRCGMINTIFSRHSWLLRKGKEQNGSSGPNKHAVESNYHGSDQDPMTKKIRELAMKIMGSSHYSSKSDISKYKLMLDLHKLKCVEFTARPSMF